MGGTAQKLAAVGVRAHTGWAAAVAVGGWPSSPVLRRERLELALGGVLAAEVYHRAREVDLSSARRSIGAAEAEAQGRTAAALRDLAASLAADGWTLAACGVVGGNTRLPDDLEAILRSHPLVHSAEGELYRQVVVRAAEAAGLRVRVIAERSLPAGAAASIGASEDALVERVAAAGKAVGSPWGRDQKEAMMVALAALALPITGR